MHWITIGGLAAVLGLVFKILKSRWELREAKHKADKAKLDLSRVRQENRDAQVEDQMQALMEEAQEGSPAVVTLPATVFARKLPDVSSTEIKRVLRKWQMNARAIPRRRFGSRFS
jgi:hypothetical protein